MSTSNSSGHNETITPEQDGGGILTNMTTPQDGDISSLTHAIVEWRRIVEEVSDYRQRVRERTKKMKALEDVILRVMKSHNIGALDMKSSGGRVLFKKTKRQGGIGGKKLKEHLVGFLKSEQQANAAIEYINANRGSVVKESLVLEIDG